MTGTYNDKISLMDVAAAALAYMITDEQKIVVGQPDDSDVEILRSAAQVVRGVYTDTFEGGLSYTVQVGLPVEDGYTPFNTYCFVKLVRVSLNGLPTANAATVLNGASEQMMSVEDLGRIDVVCCSDAMTWLGEDQTDTGEMFDVHVIRLQYTSDGKYRFTLYQTKNIGVTAV